MPKRGKAPAAEARASDRRVEDVVKRFAALSAQEQAVVADAIADAWGMEVTPPAPDQLGVPVEAHRARDSITMNPVANGEVSGSETAGVPVDNGDDAPALDGLVSGNPGLKYYPSADPYKQQGVVWVKGALELEAQLAIAVAKLNKIPKPFIGEILERISRLFELGGHRLPAVIDGLVRCYGYGDVANRLEAIALAGISGPDPTPPSNRQP